MRLINYDRFFFVFLQFPLYGQEEQLPPQLLSFRWRYAYRTAQNSRIARPARIR
jgi:hypothetical protein